MYYSCVLGEGTAQRLARLRGKVKCVLTETPSPQGSKCYIQHLQEIILGLKTGKSILHCFNLDLEINVLSL